MVLPSGTRIFWTISNPSRYLSGKLRLVRTGRKKGAKLTDAEEAVLNRKMSKKTTRKYADRQKPGEVEKPLLDQFQTGRVLAAISSGPGQCGRSDGYILEGKELEFYRRKIKSKKGK